MDWFWQALMLLLFTVPAIVLFAYAVWTCYAARMRRSGCGRCGSSCSPSFPSSAPWCTW